MIQADPHREQPLSIVQADDNAQTHPQESAEREPTAKAELLTQHQDFDTFSLLEDGTPGEPGELEVEINSGWRTTSGAHDPFEIETEIEYTPNGSEFLRDMELSLEVPVELGLGEVQGNADVTLGWMQRWVRESGLMPTLSTLTQVRLPTGYHSSGVDGTITGVAAKDLGPGTLYLNAFAKTANGENEEEGGEESEGLRHFQWGFRTGYKWRLSEQLALIGDYVHQSSEERGNGDINLLEFSGEYRVNEHFSVGPGIQIGLDNNEETPNFGAGVRLKYSF